MNQQQRAVVQQALEAFAVLKMNDYSGYECTKHDTDKIDDAETALRQLLEAQPAPVQEPEPLGSIKGYVIVLPSGAAEVVMRPCPQHILDGRVALGDAVYPFFDTAPPIAATPADHDVEKAVAYLDGVHTGKQLAKREWVDLTDEEIMAAPENLIACIAYVRNKLREKNGY
jgi:hypothetical protein